MMPSKSGVICSFIQQIFSEHLLCARLHARHRECNSEQKEQKLPALRVYIHSFNKFFDFATSKAYVLFSPIDIETLLLPLKKQNYVVHKLGGKNKHNKT